MLEVDSVDRDPSVGVPVAIPIRALELRLPLIRACERTYFGVSSKGTRRGVARRVETMPWLFGD